MAFGFQVRGWFDAWLDARVRRVVAEVVGGRNLPSPEDLAVLQRRVDALRAGMVAASEDVAGLRQAVEASALDLDDEIVALLNGDLTERLEAAESGRTATERTAERLDAALGLVQGQLRTLIDRVATLRSRADQAFQAAVTARATAEAVADALDADLSSSAP